MDTDADEQLRLQLGISKPSGQGGREQEFDGTQAKRRGHRHGVSNPGLEPAAKPTAQPDSAKPEAPPARPEAARQRRPRTDEE